MLHPWSTSQKREYLVLAGFLIISFLAYTWANRFPYFYHSDEESKALQILHGYRNYWHPMLMLNATDLICDLSGLQRNAQSVTVVGRFIAAFFSSVGVAAWVHLGIRRKGMLVGCLTGIFLLALPLLFEVGHYCKEDPALLMGFALSLCALNAFLTNPDQMRVILLGFAVGLTISAKYAGFFLFPFVLAAVLWRGRSFRLGATFFLAVIVSLLVINGQWMLHSSELVSGLKKEGNMLAMGHDGVAGRLPHFLYLRILLHQHGWPMLIAALSGWILCLINRRFSMESLLGAAFLFGIALMSFSPKISERYLLPFMGILIYLAVVGLTLGGTWIAPRWRVLFYAVFISVVIAHQVILMTRVVADFQIDSRSRLATWIGVHLPKDSQVMSSLWTRLPAIYQEKNSPKAGYLDYVADYGTVDELRRRGQRWVVVADVESEKFREVPQSGSGKSKTVFLERRLFYQQLQDEADLLWSAPKGLVYVLNPGLRLYQIRP